MGSILFTVFGTVAPMAYNMALILFVIGFFCVYVPLHERKKKGGWQSSAPKAGARERRPAPPVSGAKAVVATVLCIFIAVVGMTICMACAIMGQQLMALVGGALFLFALWGMFRAAQALRAGRQSRPPKAAPPAKNAGRQTTPSFRVDSPDHQHITSSGPAVNTKLEQLEALKEAGLLTREEYDQKRRALEKER